MAISPAYVGKEAATNLWRNRLMTAAAILTVAVSLALVGCDMAKTTEDQYDDSRNPYYKKAQQDLTFVLDGPEGVTPVRGVAPADVLATLADMGALP